MACRELPCGCCGCVTLTHRPGCRAEQAAGSRPNLNDVHLTRWRARRAAAAWFGQGWETLPNVDGLVNAVAYEIQGAVQAALREAAETLVDEGETWAVTGQLDVRDAAEGLAARFRQQAVEVAQ